MALGPNLVPDDLRLKLNSLQQSLRSVSPCHPPLSLFTTCCQNRFELVERCRTSLSVILSVKKQDDLSLPPSSQADDRPLSAASLEWSLEWSCMTQQKAHSKMSLGPTSIPLGSNAGKHAGTLSKLMSWQMSEAKWMIGPGTFLQMPRELLAASRHQNS